VRVGKGSGRSRLPVAGYGGITIGKFSELKRPWAHFYADKGRKLTRWKGNTVNNV